MRVHGAVVVHCGAQQVRAAWDGAGLVRVEGLWMTGGRLTGFGQVSVTVGPQPFHSGEEVRPSKRPPGQLKMTDDLEGDS